jgi:hypothetical protein
MRHTGGLILGKELVKGGKVCWDDEMTVSAPPRVFF